MTEHYASADAVRAMLGQSDLDVQDIDDAAKSLGWPRIDPHPFTVGERIEKRQTRG